MEALCEIASGSQQCGEETAKGFVSSWAQGKRDTSPGAWEGWWQECGPEDRVGGGREEGARMAAGRLLPTHPTHTLVSELFLKRGEAPGFL